MQIDGTWGERGGMSEEWLGVGGGGGRGWGWRAGGGEGTESRW